MNFRQLSYLFFIGTARVFALVLHPVFLIPFIMGASYSYIYPEKISFQSIASAETITGDRGGEQAEQEESKPKKKKTPLPKRGVLSQTRSGASSSSNVPGPWGQDVLSEESPPITGSVSRLGSREWVMKIINNSKDTYSASVEVEQLGRDSKRLKSDHYSYTLRGGEKVEKKYSVNQNVLDCALKLTKWKNLTKTKKKDEKPAAQPPSGATPRRIVVEPLEGNSLPQQDQKK